jgi:hypothetical protein
MDSDTDGDSFTDGNEVGKGSDPLDAADVPKTESEPVTSGCMPGTAAGSRGLLLLTALFGLTAVRRFRRS